MMEITIDGEGAVTAVKVLQSDNVMFDKRAIEAMRQFRFTPACSQTGLPMVFVMRYFYNFSITDVGPSGFR
jgi:TonB family protein